MRPKTIDAIFIRHAHDSVVYRFILKDGFSLDAIREFRDREFFDNIFPMKASMNNCLPVVSTSIPGIVSYSNLV